jgi:hypothetical protein
VRTLRVIRSGRVPFSILGVRSAWEFEVIRRWAQVGAGDHRMRKQPFAIGADPLQYQKVVTMPWGPQWAIYGANLIKRQRRPRLVAFPWPI